MPFGYLITAFASHAFSNRAVLLLCACVIAVATLANLCVRDVYRINRREGPSGS